MGRGQDIHIGVLYTRHCNSKTLQFSTRQLRDLSLQNFVQFKFVAHQLLVVTLEFGVQHLRDRHFTLYCSWDVVDILRFDQGFQIILENLGEVILKFGATEIFQNFLPVRRILLRDGYGR